MEIAKIDSAELGKWIEFIDVGLGQELGRRLEAKENPAPLEMVAALLSHTDSLIKATTGPEELKLAAGNAILNTYTGLLMTALDEATEAKKKFWKQELAAKAEDEDDECDISGYDDEVEPDDEYGGQLDSSPMDDDFSAYPRGD